MRTLTKDRLNVTMYKFILFFVFLISVGCQSSNLSSLISILSASSVSETTPTSTQTTLFSVLNGSYSKSNCTRVCSVDELCSIVKVSKSNAWFSWEEDTYECVSKYYSSSSSSSTTTTTKTSSWILTSSTTTTTKAGAFDDILEGLQEDNLEAQSDSPILTVIASHPELSTFYTVLINSGMSVNIAQQNQFYTIFAPTNSAFTSLETWQLSYVTTTAALNLLARQHITAMIATGQNGIASSSLSSLSPITMLSKESPLSFSSSLQETTQGAIITTPDLTSLQGRVHIINKVLFPYSLQPPDSYRTSTTTTTTLRASSSTTSTTTVPTGMSTNGTMATYLSVWDAIDGMDIVKTTEKYCKLSNMETLLKAYANGTAPEDLHTKAPNGITFLAPMEVGWNSMGTDTKSSLEGNPEFLLGVLGYHVLAEPLTIELIKSRTQANNGSPFTVNTWYGRPVTLGWDGFNNRVSFNDGAAAIRISNRSAPEGVVHFIDYVLSPPPVSGSIANMLSKTGTNQMLDIFTKANMVQLLNATTNATAYVVPSNFNSVFSDGSNVTIIAFIDDAWAAWNPIDRSNILLDPKGRGKTLAACHVIPYDAPVVSTPNVDQASSLTQTVSSWSGTRLNGPLALSVLEPGGAWGRAAKTLCGLWVRARRRKVESNGLLVLNLFDIQFFDETWVGSVSSITASYYDLVGTTGVYHEVNAMLFSSSDEISRLMENGGEVLSAESVRTSTTTFSAFFRLGNLGNYVTNGGIRRLRGKGN